MNIISVAIGGFIGASLRSILGQLIPLQNGFPLSTLMINLSGCFLLAWFYTVTSHYWKVNHHIRLAVGTGLIGAFTTFSTFTVDTIELINSRHVFLAIIYVLTSVMGGIALSFIGVRAGLFLKRNEVEEH